MLQRLRPLTLVLQFEQPDLQWPTSDSLRPIHTTLFQKKCVCELEKEVLSTIHTGNEYS